MNEQTYKSYWRVVWEKFRKNRVGTIALVVLILFFLVGLYAPFFASSKPLVVYWKKELYFPLFRYLFYSGFYSKPIDLFFNLLMFTFPIALLFAFFTKGKIRLVSLTSLATLHIALFVLILQGAAKDPSQAGRVGQKATKRALETRSYREDPLLAPLPHQTTWHAEKKEMSPYQKLNLVLRYHQRLAQHNRLAPYSQRFAEDTGKEMPTLFAVDRRNEESKKKQNLAILEKNALAYQKGKNLLPELTATYLPYSHDFLIAKYELEHPSLENQVEKEKSYEKLVETFASYRTPLAAARHTIESYEKALAGLTYIEERENWLIKESEKIRMLIPNFFRSFHWEDDAGGTQMANSYLPWWELTRLNRKDLVASLLFGIRVSIVVGLSAVLLSLIVGIPMGMIAGYFAGKTDLFICRMIEIWEAMPTFFMLLLVIAIAQNKSIFLVIGVLGIFGWTGFARFIRGETLRQRAYPYVLACKGMGFGNGRIMFSHILPNAIPPILTLLPFSMMAAITSEAGLSFLGLGEEGSTSWGVLMDEGRSVFPAEAYLLWPPAILLTLLLISIALVGDGLRDALDPKSQ
ncbi:MAG: Oligopeptide transport system permease protein OppC [Chlamydiae bacterium]|nr:Oligopeptide transport system permease protein OppC [Chlamydiota bacterium]